MSAAIAAGFTLWLRAARKGGTAPAADAISRELGRLGLTVEVVDAAGLAREAYRRKIYGQGASLALGMTACALNKHGIVCLIHGARASAVEFEWKRHKPARLLDVVCAGAGDPVAAVGPHLVLRPLNVDHAAGTPAGESSETPTESAWDLSPLLHALAKARWLPPADEGSNGDDELIRKRLRDLGYM